MELESLSWTFEHEDDVREEVHKLVQQSGDFGIWSKSFYNAEDVYVPYCEINFKAISEASCNTHETVGSILSPRSVTSSEELKQCLLHNQVRISVSLYFLILQFIPILVLLFN